MKFSKPGETDGETGESGGTTEMPVIETPLTDRLDLDPMPVDKTVISNAGLLDQLLSQDRGDRIKELEDRVEELEKRNEELETSLRQVYEIMDEADSIGQFNLSNRDP